MGDFLPWLCKLLGYEDNKYLWGALDWLAVLISFVGLSFGCAVSIVFVGADCWRAFKQRKHWIPGDSLLLGALALELLMLLNKPSSNFSFRDKTVSNPLFYTCKYLNVIHGEWILILVGRVSTCVLMGCLLPGVALPLSANLRTDMAALFITFALVAVYIVSHEHLVLPTAYNISGYIQSYPSSDVYRCPKYLWNTIFMQLTNVIMLVSMLSLALLLGCAALASIGIHQIVSRKIPLLLSPLKLSPRLYPPKILWEKVEEQVLKSWIVVRTSNPQYIISRSILSSSVALIITVCNALLVIEITRCSYTTEIFTSDNNFYLDIPHHVDIYRSEVSYVEYYYEGCVRPSISIPLILHYMVIILGSAVIYYRCVTAAVYYPRGMRWKLSNIREYWKIEAFWLSHLLDLKDGSKRHRRGIRGESYLTKLIVRLLRSMRLHKLLPVILWLQTFLVLFSKGCWLLSQLFFSNNLFRQLVVGSTERASGETQLQQDPAYAKYKKACVTMQGENSAGLWIANKTSIQELKKRLGKGEEEGKRCNELIALLTDKSSTGFSGQRCLEPGLPLGLNVETELNVRQRSCKMTAVSILTLIFELCSFIQNEGERENMWAGAMKACSQTWNIMDVVEYSDSEAAVLIKAADELFHKLGRESKWLDHRLPMTDSADKSPEAARAAVENLFERGKEVANAYNSKAWEQVAAGYSLCRLCRSTINDYEFNSVEEVVEGLEGVLADVIGSCIAKAAGVIAEDCKKWAINLEEERIWKAAKVVGKVKGITEKTGVMLEATLRSDIDESGASSGRHSFKRSCQVRHTQREAVSTSNKNIDKNLDKRTLERKPLTEANGTSFPVPVSSVSLYGGNSGAGAPRTEHEPRRHTRVTDRSLGGVEANMAILGHLMTF